MSKKYQSHRLEHAPTLNTVLMVEDTLMKMDKSLFTVADIKKHLPKQVNHRTLITILSYLEASNKIAVTIKGITWIHNPSPRLRKAIEKGYEI